MNMRKVWVFLLVFTLLPWVFPAPSVHALKDFEVTVNPALPGVQAEYKFYFTIEKKLEVNQWIKFKFPKGTQLPLQEENDPPEPPEIPDPPGPRPPILRFEFDHENNIITFETYLELDPAIEGYNNIVFTFPFELGTHNTQTPGSFIFEISTQAEPEWVKSKPVKIGIDHELPVFHQFEFEQDSEWVGIEESTEPWEAIIQLQTPPILTENFEKEGYYVSGKDLRHLFHWSYFGSFYQEGKVANYRWFDRANHQITFSHSPKRGIQEEHFSLPQVNGKELAWTHEPVTYNDQSFFNVMDIARFLSYEVEISQDENHFTIYDHFGRSYQFLNDPPRASIKQSGDRYHYNYRMLSPVKNHLRKLRMDLGFIMHHFVSFSEIAVHIFEPYQWEISYEGKDQLNNKWQFLFYFDSTPGEENLKNVIPLFINNRWFSWNPVMVSTQRSINYLYLETQVLAPLRDFFEAAGATVEWDSEQQKTFVIFDIEQD